MKRLLLLLPLVALLSGWGWQSKREICAQWASDWAPPPFPANDSFRVARQLGINVKSKDVNAVVLQIDAYCEYFKN